MTGKIFNIQPFSTFDGPGIRTTVFFKGCNLRCVWCHNPESFEITPQLQFFSDKCTGCGQCFSICDNGCHSINTQGEHCIDSEKCTRCGKCTEYCYSGALVMVGHNITADELVKKVLKDKLYFKNSGGGVTFSGGECMLQIDFLLTVLKQLKQEGIHIAIDTAGNVPYSSFEKINEFVDLYLYDVKAVNSDTHKKLTGVGNELILSNLKKLSDDNKRIFVRVPFIENGNADEIENISDILKGLNLEKVEILPYHKLGEGKKKSLQMETNTGFEVPTNARLEAVCQKLIDNGLNTVYSKIR